MSVLISCEVGGDFVPPQWRALDRASRGTAKMAGGSMVSQGPSLSKRTSRGSHRDTKRGTRPGSGTRTFAAPDRTARYVAARMAGYLNAPLVANDYSNALVDVRRSLHHRKLFSAATREWGAEDRQALIETIYEPYRKQLRGTLSRMLAQSSYVIHLSVESFPLSSGKKLRRADMGLLYDPSRKDEVDISLDWIDEMYDEMEMLRVRRNYPQRGTRDGITRAMRAEFEGENYIGIEMMVNRAWASREIAIRDEVIDGICWTLETVLGSPQSEAA